MTVEKTWTHKGLKCTVLHLGSHRCGYVGVEENHPAYGKDGDYLQVSVHGGITFSNWGRFHEYLENGYYWLGFDCAHAGDKYKSDSGTIKGHWWTLTEVVEETERLAEQLAEIKESQTLSSDITDFLRRTSMETIKQYKQELEEKDEKQVKK